MNSGKIALGLLAAAATGAVLGILFAPSKGAALRRKIRNMSEKEMDVMKDKFNDIADNVTQKFEKVRNNVTDYARHNMRKAEEVKTAESN